ncbi:MAG: hydrogenase maturation protease [Cyanobacteria bacterium P01_A01_bin.114]
MIATLNKKPDAKSEQMYYTKFLVIGYGDLCQGDDGVGQRVAQAVGDWNLPHVKAIAISQLKTDLVEAIASSDYVLFVNACHHKYDCYTQITPLSLVSSPGKPQGPTLAYPCSPKYLLALAQTLCGYQPQAWVLEPPAEKFEVGKPLSIVAEEGISRTLDKIALFLRSYTPVYVAS